SASRPVLSNSESTFCILTKAGRRCARRSALVAGVPVVALPGPHAHRAEGDQPPGCSQGGLEVLGSVLAEVTHAHPLGDRHPRSPTIGPPALPGPALGDTLPLGP